MCLVKELNASLTKLYIPNKEGVLIFFFFVARDPFSVFNHVFTFKIRSHIVGQRGIFVGKST